MRLSRSLAAFNAPFRAPRMTKIIRVATGARRVNDAGVELTKRYEGCRLKAYHDAVGYPTQGYGRLLSREKWANLSQFPDIDQATADAWLLEDLDSTAIGVERLFRVPLSDNEFAALVSLGFNIGLGNLQGSTLRRMILRGDSKEDCAAQFVRWNKAGGKVWRGLTRRRTDEALLFLA